MKKAMRVIISGGGTGGHIYPALAIANEIKSRDPLAQILFVGAKGRMEMTKVPQEGYAIEGLHISGLQRKLTWKNLSFPFKVIGSLIKSWKILKEFRPDIVIGTGGYASGAVVKVANWLSIPTVVQEQNSFPGITNRLLAKKAKLVFVAYPGLEQYFSKEKIVLSGNPVRQDIVAIGDKKIEALEYFKLDKTKKTLLVLGGSLGAKKINELIDENIDFFTQENWQILWQCGKLYYVQFKDKDREGIRILEFIDKMDLAYSCADIIVSRAGASSVSELMLVGKPVIFIPSPNVAEDHQTKNAMSVVERQAGILLKEKDLDQFQEVFSSLSQDPQKMALLAENIKALAKPLATKEIVDKIQELIK
ncbi:undecaprenyldiphospho-muramoylpentapeptide beta-N-acetylglucosaminyltransferase [Myroides sp. LJL116]